MKNKSFLSNCIKVFLAGEIRNIEDFSLLNLSINDSSNKFEIFTNTSSLFVGEFTNDAEKLSALNFFKELEQRDSKSEKVNELLKLASNNNLYFVGEKYLEFGNANIFKKQFIKPKGDVVVNLDEFINCIINAFEVKVV